MEVVGAGEGVLWQQESKACIRQLIYRQAGRMGESGGMCWGYTVEGVSCCVGDLFLGPSIEHRNEQEMIIDK